ncbi:MAG: hypothetical protein K2X39_05480 [Silvanigrellaceae bacterium]|nr:hypothetical protein [Silvanigrellaceae bacterium]
MESVFQYFIKILQKLPAASIIFVGFTFFTITGCINVAEVRPVASNPVILPYLRLEQAGECYYIDDFMPEPDRIVVGKNSGMYLKYYTYFNAQYKYWSDAGIMLGFYSKDRRCWALFEEYELPRN